MAEENKNQSVGQMLGKNIDVVLGDGKTYKLGQLSILDLVYLEEKFGSIDILFDKQKQFTSIVHILYCILKKNYPDLKLEDLGALLPFSYLNEHPEIMEVIVKQIGGNIQPKTDPNSPKPEIISEEKK